MNTSRPSVAWLATLVLTLGAARASAQTTFTDVPFANLGGKDLFVTITLPSTGTGPFPIAVHVHGGGWSGGSHANPGALANPMLARGFAVASVDYRLTSETGQYGAFPVTFPAQIHDVKGAIRWLRANAATYSLDPARVVAYGESAGGHLVALLATSGGVASLEGDVGGNLSFSSEVAAVADMWGPIDLLAMNADVTTPPGSVIDHDAATSPESALLGWNGPGQGIGDLRAHLADPTPPYPALAALAHDVNPVSWVDANDPPVFFVHGTSDSSVPYRQSVRLSAALTAAGVAHDLRANPLGGHGAITTDLANAAADFLVAHANGTARPVVGTPFCAGDGSAAPCPCGNAEFPGARTGCWNSLFAGAHLSASGVASVAGDTVQLLADSMPNGPALVFSGSARANGGLGAPFGDGLRCANGTVVRIAQRVSASGFLRYPLGAEPTLATFGATAGGSLHYQVWYRDAAAWCSAATWNLTNGLTLAWGP